MRKIVSSWMVVVLMMGLMFPHAVLAGDGSEAEEQWRKSVRSKRAAGTGMIIGGGVGAAVGLGVMVSGLIDKVDAANTDGCSYSGGSTIFCNNESSRQAAQDKLDQGQTKLLAGSAVSIIADGLLIWGIVKRVKASRMERRGKEKGYSLSMNLGRENEFSLALNYRF